jgi:hypothetical protein
MIFKNFDSTDIVLGRTNKVSSGFWYDGNYAWCQSLLSIDPNQTVQQGTSAYDVKNGLYYYNVFNDDPSFTYSQVHFSVTYGDYAGSGSSYNDVNTLKIYPTKAIYSEYKNYLLNPSDQKFTFRTGSLVIGSPSNTDNTTTVDGEAIFAINFSADKFKDRVDEGQLEFSLSGAMGSFSFIDDSSIVGINSNVYSIISGSVINGVPNPFYANAGSGNYLPYGAYGLFYPRSGVVILNATTINNLVGLSGSYGSNVGGMPANFRNSYNYYPAWHQYLFYGLQNAVSSSMKVRKSEYIPARHYFVRIKNQDFNYSNNPSFFSDGTDGLTKGTVKIPEFFTDPKTYITTVGLYDDSNELLAVAKLSQPTQKSFDNELLIRVRLDM